MFTRITLASLVLLPLAACVGKGPLQEKKPADACSELVMPVKAQLIQLPTGGAIMSSATLMAASASAPASSPTTTPEHCQVRGRIVSTDPSAPPLLFQVNLPTQWNGRAVQYGSANSGLAPSPLALGYVTYGSDAGAPSAAPAASGAAPAEPTHAAHKKLRDVAFQLAIRAYGHGPQKVYFVGSSEGGREGLAMAQHYPNDYDGIVNGIQETTAPAQTPQPDLLAFQKRSGKLLMLESAAAAAPGPAPGTLYYNSAVAQYGQAKVDQFMRLYATPANGDLLPVMAAWVEQDQAPAVQRCAPTLPPKEPPCP